MGAGSVSQASQSDVVVLSHGQSSCQPQISHRMPISRKTQRERGGGSNERKNERKTHGNNPIPLIFHTPSANASKFIATYTIFTIHSLLLVPSVSYLANTLFVCMRPCSGVLNSMNTIMMLNICSELPDMYIIIAFMGSAFAGASASSHAFFIFRLSISSGEDGFRFWDLDVVVRWGKRKKGLVGLVRFWWERRAGGKLLCRW